MMSRPRVAAASILVLAALPLGAQRPAPPQRGGTPRSDTPQLLVSVFASADPSLGIKAADAVRQRMQSEHSATELYLVPRSTIEQTLRASGYNPDSALAGPDVIELTKQVRSDYALTGTIERTANGIRSNVQVLTRTGPQIVTEPIAPIVGSDFGDVAKQVDRAVSEAIRGLLSYQECVSAARVGDYAKAMAAAQQGLRIRSSSAALNICALSILVTTKATPDSIIAVASRLTSIDSASSFGWGARADAYAEKGDSAQSLAATRIAHRLDPANMDMTLKLIDRLVNAGQPEPALAVVDTALTTAPLNTELLRKRWRLHDVLGRAADAIASGDAYVAVDTAAATVGFFELQLKNARAAHDTVLAHRIALKASTRFPTNVSFLLVLARDALDQSATQEALALLGRALAAEPTNSVALQLAINAHARAGNADSAIATARRALAANVPSDAIGASLVVLASTAIGTAQKSPSRAAWDAALAMAQAVDTVAPTPRSAFYVGVSAFQVATDEIQALDQLAHRPSPTRADRATTCASAKRLEDFISVVTIALPRGGRIDPEAAGKMMTGLPSYSEFVTSVKRLNCR
jgi:tetratricopeptide (TPR) repeat protein